MLRVWEEGHLTPGWSYSRALGSRIHYLLQVCPSPTNLVHFARLFQSQLLAMCRGDDDQCHPDQDQEGMALILTCMPPYKLVCHVWRAGVIWCLLDKDITVITRLLSNRPYSYQAGLYIYIYEYIWSF